MSYYFFSLTTDMIHMNRVSRVPAAQRVGRRLQFPGVRVHYFCSWLSVNPSSPPVDGYSEGRWPIANVGVHSYSMASWGAVWLWVFFSLMVFPSFRSAVLNWNIDPGSVDDPDVLPLKEGEHLEIIDKSGRWWEARTSSGRKGGMYFFFLLLFCLF